MDLLEGLETLKFEYGVPEEDRTWLFLQGRSRGLTIQACAHATFFCKLFQILRQAVSGHHLSGRVASDPSFTQEVNVGIIGGGHLGKQLAHVLLQLVPIPTENLRISSRRPEALGDLQKLGVQCFYQNAFLVNWANIVFLCCLPSQLPNICTEIQNSLDKACVVYSFVAAVPVSRLKLLLNHTNILRPQYQCAETFVNIWGSNKEIAAALQDPAILRATCPYSSAGGITLNIKWLEGVLYAALNICTAKEIPHGNVLQLLSDHFLCVHFADCERERASCPKFQLTDFITKTYAKSFPLRRPFPWFDLTAVQLKETPFSQHLAASPALQDHLTHLYCHSFGVSLTKEDQREVSAPDSPPQ